MSDVRPVACPACGGTEFVEGNLVWNGPIRFKTPDQGSFRRGEVVEARACRACGYVALFVSPSGG